MSPYQSVICEGVEYRLLYRPTGPASKCWAWVKARTIVRVDLEDVEKLRDAFLAKDDLSRIGKATPPRELRRLYEVLLSMGAPRDLILRRLGIHEPRKCTDCKQFTTDGYSGPRCEPCHELFVRTARVRNAGNKDVSGGSMSGSRRG
jgi:hypothetical protein